MPNRSKKFILSMVFVIIILAVTPVLADDENKSCTDVADCDKNNMPSDITQDPNWDAFMNSVLQSESSGDYKVINGIGYMGGFQMGRLALIDLGYVSPSSPGKGNNYANYVWTGKGGVSNYQEFLNNQEVQRQAFTELVQKNYQYLKNNGGLNHLCETACDTASGECATITLWGALKGAHLLGAGGINSRMNNSDYSVDKNKNNPGKYIVDGAKIVNGCVTKGTSSGSTGSSSSGGYTGFKCIPKTESMTSP